MTPEQKKYLVDRFEYMCSQGGAGGGRGSGGQNWVDVSSVSDRYPVYVTTNNPTPITYVPSDWVYSPVLDDMVLKNGPYVPTETELKQQKELDSYNQIFSRNRATYKGTYLSWRKEFEATGAEFAKERMLEAYKLGDEDQLEKYPSIAKSEPAVSRKPEVVWPVLGIIVIAVMILLAIL